MPNNEEKDEKEELLKQILEEVKEKNDLPDEELEKLEEMVKSLMTTKLPLKVRIKMILSKYFKKLFILFFTGLIVFGFLNFGLVIQPKLLVIPISLVIAILLASWNILCSVKNYKMWKYYLVILLFTVNLCLVNIYVYPIFVSFEYWVYYILLLEVIFTIINIYIFKRKYNL